MVVAKKYVLVKAFDGFPSDENIALQEETLPSLQDGEVLFEAVYLTVDPYMRLFPLAVGSVMMGEQVAKVIESKNAAYSVGSLHVAKFGWRSHTVADPTLEEYEVRPVPDMGGLAPSLCLGICGMPGETAYLALLETAELRDGDTVIITSASGAVGNVMGQIARMKNCNVIGFAGSDAKLAWLKELGFNHAFNYKTCDVSECLKRAAPDGANVYIDHVSIGWGGVMATTIINNHMAPFGRVAAVGNISAYNARETPTGPFIFWSVLINRLTVRGMVHGFMTPEERHKPQPQLIQWVKEGKLVAREHVTKGFENMREAFYGLFKGENIGKAIVQV